MKLKIKVIPSSSRDLIAGWLDDALKIKVRAPAEKGRANKSVISLLERSLQLPKGSISIDSGSTSNYKIIEIQHTDIDIIEERLKNY